MDKNRVAFITGYDRYHSIRVIFACRKDKRFSYFGLVTGKLNLRPYLAISMMFPSSVLHDLRMDEVANKKYYDNNFEELI